MSSIRRTGELLRAGLKIILLLAAVAVARSNATGGAGREDRPNILCLVTDDQRWDTLGSMGNNVVQTPQLDALARRGVLFQNAFVTTPICCTSRASILSGQYARRHRINDFVTAFSEEAQALTYPHLLRLHGYRTGFVGKYGVGRKPDLPVEDYDYWAGFAGQNHYFPKGKDHPEAHLTDLLRERALEFIESCDGDQPFCLSISFKAPHCQDGDPDQFLYLPRLKDLYAGQEIPAPATAGGEFFARLPDFLRESEARRRWRVRFSTPELHQRMVKGYYRLITGVDRAVGRIMAALRDRGLAKNTIVLVIGDNGFFLGEHGLAGKWFMHEESIRVPLLIHDPRLPEARKGRRPTEMVLNIDVAPTILSLAGVPAPAKMQGRDLMPLVRGGGIPWREDWFFEHLFEHDTIPKSEGVRTARYAYWEYLDRDQDTEWLFDLDLDPRQVNNLANDPEYAAIQADLARRLARYRIDLR